MTTNAPRSAILASAIATAEIGSVLARRIRAADRFDLDGGMACQDPGGRDDHGAFSGSFDDVRKFLEERERRAPAIAKFHRLGNLLVERRGEAEAFSECYLVAREFHLQDGQPVNFENGARYLDHWRLGRHWRIARRSIVYDWSRVSHNPVAAVGGRRSIEDRLFAHWPELWGAAPPPTLAAGGVADPHAGRVSALVLQHEASALLYRLARACDRGDPDLALSCFAPGAVMSVAGRERLACDIIRRELGRGVRTFHFLPHVALLSADPACPVAETHFRRRSRLTFDAGYELDATGRYMDQFSRVDGRLRIDRRTVHYAQLRRDAPAAKYWSRFDMNDFEFGSRDGDDPLYRHIDRHALSDDL